MGKHQKKPTALNIATPQWVVIVRRASNTTLLNKLQGSCECAKNNTLSPIKHGGTWIVRNTSALADKGSIPAQPRARICSHQMVNPANFSGLQFLCFSLRSSNPVAPVGAVCVGLSWGSAFVGLALSNRMLFSALLSLFAQPYRKCSIRWGRLIGELANKITGMFGSNPIIKDVAPAIQLRN